MSAVNSIELFDSRTDVGIRGFVPAPILSAKQCLDAAYVVRVDTIEPEPGVLAARATVTNSGTGKLRIDGLRWRFDPKRSDGPALAFPLRLKPQVFSTSNLRGEYFFTGTVEGDRFAYPLTNQHVEFGLAEDHFFPGVFVAAADEPIGLLVAQASQERFHAMFRFLGRMEGRERWLFEIEERAGGGGLLDIEPGAEFHGEWLFFNLVESNDPQRSMDAYYRYLRARGAFARRELNPLPKQRIYCTWNYDFMDNIDEAKFLGQIPVLKKYFPSVSFLQLDDGYQRCHAPRQRAMIDLCYGDLETPFNPVTFPSGPKALAEQVKAQGLRPAIWLGLWASMGSAMLRDHPEWVLRDDTGLPLLFDKWYGGTAVLDPSCPGVLDYLDRLCATVFGEWGFEGVKLDFSSFAFNGKRFRFREPGKTAIELRHELEAIFRRHLPADGFFGWCVVAGTAQPFLAQADYFRNAIDIGHGRWETARRIALWTANTLMFMTEKPCLPNIDSIGWNAAFDETSWTTWLNFCAISGAALEVSGDLRKLSEARLQRLARTLELSDPDRVVRAPGLGACRGVPPVVWRADGATSVLVGAFNWTEEPVRADFASATPELVGVEAREVWSGEVLRVPASLDLPPRGSALWEVVVRSERRSR